MRLVLLIYDIFLVSLYYLDLILKSLLYTCWNVADGYESNETPFNSNLI